MRRPIAYSLSVIALAIALGCDAAPVRSGPGGARPDVQPLTLDASNRTGRLLLPNSIGSVKFAVIGDSGRGNAPQHEVAAQMVAFRGQFDYTFVLMLGDNIYEGPASPEDYRQKFEEPYRALLDAGVTFHAVLGNHDDPNQVYYEPFGMKGHRYYTFGPPSDLLARLRTSIRFFAIDSTNLDRGQMQWLEKELSESRADWKIAYLHHPLYTSGRYRDTSRGHRWALEPLLVKYGADVVFTGHEHIYQRSKIMNGILYFVSGGAGSLRLGDGAPAQFIARTFDDDYHFMLVEIDGDGLHFQVIARNGETVDAGTFEPDEEDVRQAEATPAREPTPADTPAPR